jgi:hypothetical protein
MKRPLLIAALLAGVIAGTICFVGSWLPFRPDAWSERTWSNAWGLVGMFVGIAAARWYLRGGKFRPAA